MNKVAYYRSYNIRGPDGLLGIRLSLLPHFEEDVLRLYQALRKGSDFPVEYAEKGIVFWLSSGIHFFFPASRIAMHSAEGFLERIPPHRIQIRRDLEGTLSLSLGRIRGTPYGVIEGRILTDPARNVA